MKNKMAIISILALSACGTLFNGSSQDVSFDSNIKGVTIYINGVKACKTPCVYPVDRSSSSVVAEAKIDGYEDQQQIIRSKLSTVSILNLTFWPSWLTDVATGGMWQYSRDGVYVDMEKPTKKQAEMKIIEQNVKIRKFALFNYNELKIEASGNNEKGEYISTLALMSGKKTNELLHIINSAKSEVELVRLLVKDNNII